MIENVIFFDFDGVLAGVADWPFYKGEKSKWPRRVIENNRIKYINHMLRFHNVMAIFFPISGWSYTFNSTDKIQTYLNKMNADRFIPPESPEVFYSGSNRAEFVLNYTRKYDIINYIVLDDEYAKDYKAHKIKHITTDSYDGLTHKTFMKLDKVIERWAKQKQR